MLYLHCRTESFVLSPTSRKQNDTNLDSPISPIVSTSQIPTLSMQNDQNKFQYQIKQNDGLYSIIIDSQDTQLPEFVKKLQKILGKNTMHIILSELSKSQITQSIETQECTLSSDKNSFFQQLNNITKNMIVATKPCNHDREVFLKDFILQNDSRKSETQQIINNPIYKIINYLFLFINQADKDELYDYLLNLICTFSFKSKEEIKIDKIDLGDKADDIANYRKNFHKYVNILFTMHEQYKKNNQTKLNKTQIINLIKQISEHFQHLQETNIESEEKTIFKQHTKEDLKQLKAKTIFTIENGKKLAICLLGTGAIVTIYKTTGDNQHEDENEEFGIDNDPKDESSGDDDFWAPDTKLV